MGDMKKNNDELTEELRRLRNEYDCLKSSYKKEIYKLKQTEEILRESELKYRWMFNVNPLPNWIYSPDNYSFIEVNDAVIELFGYSREEFLTMTLKDIESQRVILNPLKNEKSANRVPNVKELSYIKKNGEVIFAEVCLFPTVINRSEAIHAIVYDITKRKQTEKELIESEIYFRRSIYESTLAIRIDTVDGETVFVNKALLALFELNSFEEFRSLSIINRYTSESYKEHLQREEVKKNGEEVLEYDVSLRGSNHEIRHFKVSKIHILWEGSLHFQIIIRDITEFRNAVDKLRLYSKVVERSTNAICISDSEGTIEYVNPRTLEVTGYSEAEMIGANTRIFGSGLKPKEEYTALWKTIKSGNVWSSEVCNKKKNGQLYWESITISPVFDNHERITHFFSVKIDITEHKRLIQELILAKEYAEEREIFFQTFIQHIPFEIWVIDMNNIGIIENREHIEHFGSILGKEFKPDLLNSKNGNLLESKIKRIVNGEIINEECYCKINKKQKRFQQIAFPIYKETKIIGMAGLNIDITERRSAEIALINSEKELRRFASHLQNVREEEKGSLAREIHDDLGQILVALKIDLGLMKQQILKNNPLSEGVLAKLDGSLFLIDNAIYSARRIMNGLRHEKLEILGLEDAMIEYIHDFTNRYQLDCDFRFTISRNEIDQQQTLIFFRIFQESMTNIIKHAQATSVRIKLGNKKNKIFMEIIDNGIGFDRKNSGRKDSYGIIGMKERVALLKGKLSIISKVGEGTNIRVEIPNLKMRITI